ncbi:MAG TPA: hypothetical protein VHP63_01820, partial [candidate division Zixibacteria bacterium]|nr:hypothetical protein [candidate division Zixibacteria bacterium]
MRKFYLTAVFLFFFGLTTHAIGPTLINYQGLLTDGSGNALDTTANVTFRIFDVSSGGAAVWTETQSVTSVDGLFSVLLGTITPISEVIIDGPNKFLETQLGAGPFSPRTQLVSMPYSIRVRTVDGANGGSISSDVNIFGKANIGNGNSNTGAFALVVGEDNTASGDYSSIGGGSTNTAANTGATIGGGISNQAQGPNSTVSGGNGNGVFDQFSTVGGGSGNTANGFGTTIGGGYGHQAYFNSSTISGGYVNTASNDFATVSGGYYNTASGTYATVGGGRADTAKGIYSGVASGYLNLAGDNFIDTGAFVGGGINNTAASQNAAIGGGANNSASGFASTIAGGSNNLAIGTYSTISGGFFNQSNGQQSFVGGGQTNSAISNWSTIGGGVSNVVGGDYATIPGGVYNRASGHYSLAAGTQAKAIHSGSIVLAANSFVNNDTVVSSGPEQMVLRADGGYYMTSTGGTANIPVTDFLNTSTGAHLTTGGAWTNASDKNSKENFSDIDEQSV